jgi:hypothetical protein
MARGLDGRFENYPTRDSVTHPTNAMVASLTFEEGERQKGERQRFQTARQFFSLPQRHIRHKIS